MSVPNPAPEILPAGAPRLLTLSEAAAETGLSQKAIARRVERGTLRAVHDEHGRRVVPRAELDRAGLLGRGSPAGELVLWRELYERERDARDLAERERAELRELLAAIANAGPIRAARLRRQARALVAQPAGTLAGNADPRP